MLHKKNMKWNVTFINLKYIDDRHPQLEDEHDAYRDAEKVSRDKNLESPMQMNSKNSI